MLLAHIDWDMYSPESAMVKDQSYLSDREAQEILDILRDGHSRFVRGFTSIEFPSRVGKNKPLTP